MFVSPEFLANANLPPVVIIGSGPAGMTLALSLAERRISTLILEAGDMRFDDDIQDDYIGEITGDPYFDLDATRLRQFGGTSNHWAGRSRLMDAWDFDSLPELGIPGWPISKTDLDPYTAQANDILEIPDAVDHAMGDGLFEAGFVFSPPVNFGMKYEETVTNSPFINVALRTAVTSLHADEGRVARIDIVDAEGQAHSIAPQYVVLAAGGIENPRLLLWSNEVSAQRIVANENALGRYWMEHPHDNSGIAIVREGINQGPLRAGAFSVSVERDVLLQHGALNAAIRLHPIRNDGLEAQMKNGICDVAPEMIDLMNSMRGSNATCGHTVRIAWEQEPDIDNRIALSETSRDSFGNPRAHLFWRKTAQDYHTVKVAFELTGAYLARSGNGAARANPHLIEMVTSPDEAKTGGHHHMGSTRMAASAAQGVVNSDLRIHGMANAYVAGSSVFTRGGHTNPTLSIVQLSLRLGDHLSGIVSG